MANPYDIAFAKCEQDLTCIIERRLLKDAVTLKPCMHKVSEVAAQKMFGSENGKICPSCKGNVSKYAVDQPMRDLAYHFETLKASAIQLASPPKEEKIEENKAEEKVEQIKADDGMEVCFRGCRFSLAEGILDLSKFKDLSDEDLDWFAEKAPHIKELNVSSDKITRIPFQHLKKLECYSCSSLQKISSEAEEITCTNSDALSEFLAPKAKKVEIRRCGALLELTLESAEDVKITNCDKLAKLFLPLAKKVDCPQCNQLLELSCPEATWINCSRVPATKRHEFANAETVICVRCKFEELSLPKVKRYDNSYSESVKLVYPKDAKFLNLGSNLGYY